MDAGFNRGRGFLELDFNAKGKIYLVDVTDVKRPIPFWHYALFPMSDVQPAPPSTAPEFSLFGIQYGDDPHDPTYGARGEARAFPWFIPWGYSVFCFGYSGSRIRRRLSFPVEPPGSSAVRHGFTTYPRKETPG